MNPQLIDYVFVDEAGQEFTPHIDTQYLVVRQVLNASAGFREGVGGLGRYYALQMRIVLRRLSPEEDRARGHRWVVLEAREVIADGPGEAMELAGRQLGSRAIYGGESAQECQQRYQTLLTTMAL